MADKVRDNHLYSVLNAKYAGLGNTETLRDEAMEQMHRDTLASIAMHDNILTYNAVATNTHREIVRQNLIQRMVDPLSKK